MSEHDKKLSEHDKKLVASLHALRALREDIKKHADLIKKEKENTI